MFKKIFYLLVVFIFFISTNCYASLITITDGTNLVTTSGVSIVTTDHGVVQTTPSLNILDIIFDEF